MIKPLKKGDPVRVRLASGEVVEAEYFCASGVRGCHHLTAGGSSLMAIGRRTLRARLRPQDFLGHECIFVGPPAVCAPIGGDV